jgi:hypothetical protein
MRYPIFARKGRFVHLTEGDAGDDPEKVRAGYAVSGAHVMITFHRSAQKLGRL